MFYDIYIAFLIFILGLVTGSFLNVCIYRIPLKKSVVRPGSSCTKCNTFLKPLDLIPVVSYVLLRGRCRYCKEKVSPRYALVEILTALLFAGSYLKTGLSVELVFFLVFVSLMIIISFIDIKHRIIPDRLAVTGGLAVIAYLFSPMVFENAFSGPLFADTSAVPLRSFLLGGLAGGGFLLVSDLIGRIAYKKEGMGFGDVKMMLWAGAFLGLRGVVLALFTAVLTGAVAGIIIIAKDKKQKGKEKSSGRYMPFGPFLAFGSILSLFFAQEILSMYFSLFPHL